MRDPHEAYEDLPVRLLDDHLTLAQRAPRTALPATAVRTRSVAARPLLARAALGDAASLPELLDAARRGDARWLRRIRHRVQPAMVAALAQTIALQDVLATDQHDAVALYDLIRAGLGAGAVPAGHQGLHAQLAFIAGGAAAARPLLSRYPRIRAQIRADLSVDLQNPFAGPPGRSATAWLAAFQALLPAPGVLLEDGGGEGGGGGGGKDGGGEPFDRLRAAPVEPVEGPHRISVIVTAYRPDAGLLTAVRSIVAQSWRNVEVVVVDDASGERYEPVLRECLTLGGRIRLVRLDTNCGTYAARNAGLDAAEGEFVAFQDSDDFSHPRRLEWQVRPLLADPRLVASTSDGMAVTAQLLLTRPSVRSSRFNPSSLLFRRDAVMRRLGYFDAIRKGADSEYVGRIEACFGEPAVHHVEAGPLALIRLTEESLSREEVRPFWIHPARAAYCSAYGAWHEQVSQGGAPPYRPRDDGARPFAAPEHLRVRPGTITVTRRYDVVYVADWRFLEGAHRSALDEVRAVVADGRRVAVMHLESYRTPLRRRYPLARAVQQLVNDGVVDQVLPAEALDVALVVVRQPTVLQFPPEQPFGLRARRVVVVADRAPERGDGTDARYDPGTCTRTALRMFGVEPSWCPTDQAVREALRDRVPPERLTAFDLPAIVEVAAAFLGRPAQPFEARLPAQPPVVGTDLADCGGWPADLGDAVAVFRRLDGVDVRVRLPTRPPVEPSPRLPTSWLIYAASDLDAPGLIHQLDVYLHFPPPESVETFSRPALDAAALGCVVLMPERFAATHGDTAVYCSPAEVPDLVARYHGDRALADGQRRAAAAAIAEAHHPRLFVDRVTAALRGVRTPTQRRQDAAVP